MILKYSVTLSPLRGFPDINECADQPCVHGTCEDDVNGYTCTCEQGYTGLNCDEGEVSDPRDTILSANVTYVTYSLSIG